MLLLDNKMKKTGILLPIFSLYNEYGIGTLGKQAYKFIDFIIMRYKNQLSNY